MPKSKKLTLVMKKALIGLAADDQKYSAYRLGCSQQTLEALRIRGFAEPSNDTGYMFSPSTHRWLCTAAGRAEAQKLRDKAKGGA